MSKTKKRFVRENFRIDVFKRDQYKCRVCGDTTGPFDAHHITDRNDIVNGGYVEENGISLCPECHLKAEDWHQFGTGQEKYSPENLYKLIGSSREKADNAASKL